MAFINEIKSLTVKIILMANADQNSLLK